MGNNTYFITCPLEPKDYDKVRSFEVDISTGEYYCHNCKVSGDMNKLDEETKEKIYYRIRKGEI